MSTQIPFENKTRSVEIDQNKIIFTLKCDGSKHYFTYDPTLYEILCNTPTFNRSGRLVFAVEQNRNKHRIYAYDVALACHRKKIIKGSNLVERMRPYFKCKKDREVEVDHLDSYVNNNTILNLMLMRESLNRSKSDITARVQEPNYLTCCYWDGQLLIRYREVITEPSLVTGEINRELLNSHRPMIPGTRTAIATRNILCKDTNLLVRCLKDIVTSTLVMRGFPITQPPKTAKGWIQPRCEVNLDNVTKSIEKQEQLASDAMNDSRKFTIWTIPE